MHVLSNFCGTFGTSPGVSQPENTCSRALSTSFFIVWPTDVLQVAVLHTEVPVISGGEMCRALHLKCCRQQPALISLLALQWGRGRGGAATALISIKRPEGLEASVEVTSLSIFRITSISMWLCVYFCMCVHVKVLGEAANVFLALGACCTLRNIGFVQVLRLMCVLICM